MRKQKSHTLSLLIFFREHSPHADAAHIRLKIILDVPMVLIDVLLGVEGLPADHAVFAIGELLWAFEFESSDLHVWH